jgi:hypothetical protein
VTSSRQPSTGVGADDATQAVPIVDPSDVSAAGRSTKKSATPGAGTGAGEASSGDADKPAGAGSGADPAADPATDPATAAASDPAASPPGADAGPVTHPRGRRTFADEVDMPEPVSPGEPGGDFEPIPERRISSAARRTGKVRKARLRLLRVEPWSVMKSAFVLSIAIGITFVVATATLWSIVDAAGVFETVGSLITQLTESEGSAGVEVANFVGFSRVVGLATVIAVVDVVLLTALATLFAFLYNLSAALLGGFEITLAEDD